MEHYLIFVTAFGVSALGGLAALLRSNLEVTRKNVATYVLNTGCVGLGVSLVWWHQFQTSPEVLVGICVVAGLSGIQSVDLLVAGVKKLVGVPPESKEKGNG